MEYQGIYKIGGIRIVMSNFISNKIKEIKIDSDDYLLIVLFANGITKVVDFKEKIKVNILKFCIFLVKYVNL